MFADLLAHVALAANTNFKPSKIGMADRNIGTQIADAAAMGTIRVTETSARCNRRIRL